ncbi:hypothetical protein AB0D91_41755, partial [Streptomyces canus]|uniref:hypothetical protein n=1 Tax=Streptomyces canus TaxID=58343 RepID=UPI00340F774B
MRRTALEVAAVDVLGRADAVGHQGLRGVDRGDEPGVDDVPVHLQQRRHVRVAGRLDVWYLGDGLDDQVGVGVGDGSCEVGLIDRGVRLVVLAAGIERVGADVIHGDGLALVGAWKEIWPPRTPEPSRTTLFDADMGLLSLQRLFAAPACPCRDAAGYGAPSGWERLRRAPQSRINAVALRVCGLGSFDADGSGASAGGLRPRVVL